jgi:hypothetical protein
VAGSCSCKEKTRTVKSEFTVRVLAGTVSKLLVEAFHKLWDWASF